VYEAFDQGSRNFELGHTWDGAPLPSAVGLAVLRYLKEHRLVERVAEKGPALRAKLEAAVKDSRMVREVRGQGFLLGLDYVDPRDRSSFLPPDLGVARRIDAEALERRLIVYSTQPTRDGFSGDQTLMAPAFTSTDEELDLMVERMASTVFAIEEQIAGEL